MSGLAKGVAENLSRFFVEKELMDVYNYEENRVFSYAINIGDAMFIS